MDGYGLDEWVGEWMKGRRGGVGGGGGVLMGVVYLPSDQGFYPAVDHEVHMRYQHQSCSFRVN